jgi:plastocyanin
MRFRTLLAVPFIALSIAGCGSSNSGGGGNGGGATVPAGTLVITAIDGIAWDAKSYSATAVDGKVNIAIKNDSSLPHNLHLLDSSNTDVGLALSAQNRGDIKSDDYPLAPGTYQVICTVAGHGNMKATLTVK